MDRVDFALVTDAAGAVLASSDETWAAPGLSVDEAAFPLVADVTRRVIADDGYVRELWDEAYHLDLAERVTVASYPVVVGDRLIGVVTVQGEPLDLGALPSRSLVVREIVWQVLKYLPVIAVPALLISVPVGIWRARAVAKRLSRLAAAADAMAKGDPSVRVAATGEDEVGRLGERFNDMTERLAAADWARKAFVANDSHELRTPVAIIHGHVERLLAREAVVANGLGAGGGAGVAVAERGKETAALGAIHREALTLSRLIDDLFTLARLEETALPLQVAPLRPIDVAIEAVEGLRTLAWNQRKVTVRSLAQADVPAVLADRTRVRQILNNLLYNSLRHTPEGGLIIVDAGWRPEAGLVEVSVTDTGVGISAAELANVFARFYRGERGARHEEGRGLGQHIVKQPVEARHGTIDAESEPGLGTTFRFTLPVAP